MLMYKIYEFMKHTILIGCTWVPLRLEALRWLACGDDTRLGGFLGWTVPKAHVEHRRWRIGWAGAASPRAAAGGVAMYSRTELADEIQCELT